MVKRSPSTLLAFTGFIVTTSGQMSAPILSLYALSHLRASTAEIGLIFSIFSLSSLVVRLLMGLIFTGDFLMKALIAGLVINSSSMISYAVAPNVPALVGIRAIHGAAFAFDVTTMLTLSSLVASSDQEVSSSLSRYTTGVALGLMLGPAIGTLTVTALGLRYTLVAAGIASIPAIIAASILFRESRGMCIWPDSRRPSTNDLKMLFYNDGLKLSTLIYLCYTIAYGVVLAYAPVVGKLDLEMREENITLLFFGYFAITLICRALLPKILRRISITRLLLISLSAAAAGLFTMGISASLALFVLGFELTALGHGFIFPLTAMIVAKTITPELRMLGNSIYLSSWDAGLMIGPLFSSALTVSLPLRATIAVMASTPMIGLALASRVKRLGLD
ncbi:MAG: MFS transporter [Nitrososphaerota archaeon]